MNARVTPRSPRHVSQTSNPKLDSSRVTVVTDSLLIPEIEIEPQRLSEKCPGSTYLKTAAPTDPDVFGNRFSKIPHYVCDNSIKGVSFYRNCGAASVGVLQDNLVLSTELTM